MLLIGGCALVAAGCDTAEGVSDTDAPSDTEAQTQGPMILEVVVNTETVGTGDIAELTILATHSAALDEIVGGLVRVDENVLGPLVQVSGGAFSYVVTHDELLDAAGDAGGTIAVDIEVLDNRGETTSSSVEIEVCGVGTAVCTPGQCNDILSSDQTCGSCSNRCDTNEECIDGFCVYSSDGYDTGYYGAADYDDAVTSAEEDAAHGLDLPIPLPAASRVLDPAAFNLR